MECKACFAGGESGLLLASCVNQLSRQGKPCTPNTTRGVFFPVPLFPFDEKTGDRSKARHAWGALIQSRTTNLWHVCNVFFCEYTHFYSIIKCLYFATRLIYPHPLVYKIKYMAKCMKFVGRCIKFVVTCFKIVGIYNKDL